MMPQIRISSKHQSEAQHPISAIPQAGPPITQSFGPLADVQKSADQCLISILLANGTKTKPVLSLADTKTGKCSGSGHVFSRRLNSELTIRVQKTPRIF
jgi:hypothetical protein